MWAEGRPEFKLLQVKTCYEVGSDYPSVEMVKEGKKERVKVIPDAWLLFEKVRDSAECPILLEIDRGRPSSINLKIILRRELSLLKEGECIANFLGVKLGWFAMLQQERRKSTGNQDSGQCVSGRWRC
jgi:hypothetical protein